MAFSKKVLYIIFIILVIGVFIFYNFYNTSFKEGLLTQNEKDEIERKKRANESSAFINNKDNTTEMTALTADAKLDDLASQIKECQTLIDEINIVLPRQIQDISIGTVNQTEDLDQVGVTIDQGITSSLDPITNKQISTGTWTINAVLPRGKQGPRGVNGPKGFQGEHGPLGIQGDRGIQGPWGKDCGNNCD